MTTPRPQSAFTLVIAILVTISVGGCPGSTDLTAQTRAPVADAGPDQTVAAGSDVFLNGTGVGGENGSTLTYLWQQTEGEPAVTLAGDSTASASFVAPNAAALLMFQLTVADDRGRTATDSVIVTVAPRPAPKSVLYVANFGSARITTYSFASPESLTGNVVPDTELSGLGTLLVGPGDLVIDNHGGLLVSNFTGKSITGYPDALNPQSITGNLVPTRVVSGPATGLSNPVSMAFNAESDLLFVAEYGVNAIHVFANASADTFTGNVAPMRNIESADIDKARGINFGHNDELYVANMGNNTVAVFGPASTLDGTVTAKRVIHSPAFKGVFDVFVDANDTLYVLNNSSGGNKINIFSGASSGTGTVTPTATLTIPGAANIIAVIVDSAGNGYVTDSNNPCAIYGYSNIAARNGVVRPDRTLTGPSTQLATPLRVYLHE